MLHAMALPVSSGNNPKSICLRKCVGTWGSEAFAFFKDFWAGFNGSNVIPRKTNILAGGIQKLVVSGKPNGYLGLRDFDSGEHIESLRPPELPKTVPNALNFRIIALSGMIYQVIPTW